MVLLTYSYAVEVALQNDSRLVVLEEELMSLPAYLDDLLMQLQVLGDFGTMVGFDIEAAHGFGRDMALVTEHDFDAADEEDLAEEQ